MALINTLTEIGNAIREKTGGTKLIPLKEMASAILTITTGDGGTDTRLKDFIEGTLTEIVDDTITTVKQYAFYNSTVQKIDLPNCITVAKSGISPAKSLTSLNLPNCTSVGDSGISSCSSLTSLVLPNCESVGESGFAGCSKLTRLELPKVKTIGSRAFYNCSALTTLIISTNQVATIGSTYPFTGSAIQNNKGYIYVPDDLVESYKTANVWSDQADRIKGLSELTT